MLFRTVYGPELKAIHAFVVQQSLQNHPPLRHDVHRAFIPILGDKMGKTQNVDDALSFLLSAGLIVETKTGYRPVSQAKPSFRCQLLRAMRRLETGQAMSRHPADALYSLLLNELFIRPNRLFIQDLHAQTNQLRQVRQVGGLSKEKTQAWKRVMEFLGVGRRVAGGFLCTYTPQLIAEIIGCWKKRQGTLQSFLETCLGRVLPFACADGEIADGVAAAFYHLTERGHITLLPLQDSPSRPYFGERQWKSIERHVDG